MTDSSPHRRREIRMHSNILTQEDVVEAHRIQLAAIAAANQTLDDSEPTKFVPHSNPNQLLEFGRPVEPKKGPSHFSSNKKDSLNKVLRKANIPTARRK